MPARHIKSRQASRKSSTLPLKLLLAALFTGGPLLPALSVLAAPPLPGTEIRNQATGSFVNPADSSTTNIESNEVVVRVSEVAGVTISGTTTPTEAPSGVSGAGSQQGNGDINAGDVVYFTYTVTNVGNDPTQFFIPGAPSAISNGALQGNIEIIGFDLDGAGSGSATDLSGSPVSIPSAGAVTDTLTIPGLTGGSLPAGGTLTLRVPIKVSTSANDGDQVTVVLGDTDPVDQQNQPYSDDGNDRDLYTQDNSGTDNGDTNGPPVNGDATNRRQEASLQQQATVVESTDFGDAPDTYGDASHETTALYLGSTAPDSEADTQASPAADGDDNNGTDDEDGITNFPTLNDSTTSYSLDVTVNNSGGAAANVYAWIDFDRDGAFDEDERATVANGTVTLDGNGRVPNNASGTVQLNWNNIGSSGPDLVVGDSYIRVRVTRDDLDVITNQTANQDDASLGVASDGEVEDYDLAITVAERTPFICDDTAYQVYSAGSSVQLASIDFNTGDFNDIGDTSHNLDYNAIGFNPADNLIYGSLRSTTGGATGNPGDIVVIDSTGNASVVGSVPGGWPSASGAISADFIADNKLAFVSPTELRIVDVVTLTLTTVSLFTSEARTTPFPFDDTNDVAFNPKDGLLYGLSKPGGRPVDAQFVSINPVTGEVKDVGGLVNVNSGLGAMFADSNGHVYGAFNRGTSNLGFNAFVRFDLNNGSFTPVAPSPRTRNNDGASCNQVPLFNFDYGDAPDDYGSPSHLIPDAPTNYLGAIPPDADPGVPQNAANGGADGTGDEATGGDEDGITLPPLTAGDTDYTIETSDITATGSGTLHAWVDFNQNNAFEVGEYQSVAVSGNVVAGNLSWTGLSGITAGTTYARFRFTPDTLTDDGATTNVDERALGVATDGEVEDYQVEIASTLPFPPGPGLGNSICSATTPSNAFGDIGIRWEHNDNGGTSPDASIDRTDLFSSATVASFVGLTAQINGFDINIDRTTIPESFSASDYIQYQFTTADLGTISAEITAAAIALFEKADASDNQASGAYNFAVLIDEDSGFNSPEVLLNQVSVNNGDTTDADVVFGPQDFGSSVYRLAHYDANGTTVPLASNTAYTVRVYIYGPTTSGEDAGQPFPEIVIWDDFLLKAVSCSSAPNILLAKRITAINRGQTDELLFTNFVDDPNTTDDNETNWPDSDGISNNINTYLQGSIDGGNVEPGDEVEFTVYFLSNGDIDAQNVRLCDVVPDYMTFVPDAFGVGQGLALASDDSSLPTVPTTILTNDTSDDAGDFFAPGTAPTPAGLCEKHDSSNPGTFVDVTAANNDNGTVLFSLGNVPTATSAGTPTNSYGFIRFRATVK